MLSTLTHLVIATVKDDILQQLTVQTTIVEFIAHRGLETHLVVQLLVVADEPDVIALEGVLELEAHLTIQCLDVLDVEALAIGRIADERASLGHQFDFVEVATLQLDILVQAGILDIGTGDGDGLALDVAAIDLVGKLALGTIIIIYLVKQVGVIVGPLLEGIVVAIHARSDIGTDECSLDEESARAAHGINQVGLAIPSAEQDDTGCQYLVDGSIGLGYTPATLEQRVATAVERQRDVTSRDMDVKTDIGIGEADARTLAVLLIEEVGNGILDTIGDKTGIIEFLAIDRGIDGKGRVYLHQLLPVKGLQLLIQVIGTAGTQLEERFQHTHCRATGEIRPIEHFLVSFEGNDTVSLIHVLGTQGA